MQSLYPINILTFRANNITFEYLLLIKLLCIMYVQFFASSVFLFSWVLIFNLLNQP